MQWNDHSRHIREGSHAFLGASKYSWINYDDEKLITTFENWTAAQRGTELHEFAKRAIELKQRLKGNNNTIAMYVNDAIGFKMQPEQILYYSDNCFGTADAIAFRSNQLRIHDLKTGVTPASLHQLEIYASLFCLEYDVKPGDIKIELRIYQNDDILIGNPQAEDILPIMDKIIRFDKLIEEIKEGE